jgi:protein gp37
MKWTGEVRLIEKDLEVPLHWKRPRKIFVASMSDPFHEAVPDAWLDRIFAVMAQAQARGHIFQLLTKRPERMHAYIAAAMPRVAALLEPELGPFPDGIIWPLRGVWLGVSCENQATADERLPWLLKTPAARRFVSDEPALGPIDFRQIKLRDKGRIVETIDALLGRGTRYTGELGYCAKLDWIVWGGESGPGFRPCKLDWLEQVAEDCREWNIPLWVKQDAALRPGQQGRIPDALWALKQLPAGQGKEERHATARP